MRQRPRHSRVRYGGRRVQLPAWAARGLEWLRTSFWVIPTSMCLLAWAGSAALPWLDSKEDWLAPVQETFLWWVVYDGNPGAARSMLAAIAGGAVGLAGTVFSITVAALSLASSQLGPRLLRTFITDRGNQFTLGTFTGTHVFALLSIRHVYGTAGSDNAFVPQLTVTVAVMLAMLSILVLVWFIHHLSMSIQTPHVVTEVGRDFDDMIDKYLTAAVGHCPDEVEDKPGARVAIEAASVAFADPSTPDISTAEAAESGYVQAIDHELLFERAVEYDLQIKLLCRAGAWVFRGLPVMLIRPARELPDGERDRRELMELLASCVLVGPVRTMAQDVEFARDQVVEVGSRALSPGINDPFTAMHCVDRLADGLLRVGLGTPPAPTRFDDDGRLRLWLQAVDFAGMVGGGFDALRGYASTNPQVQLRLLEVIGKLAQVITRPADREALRSQACQVVAQAEQHLVGRDLAALRVRQDEIAELLNGHDTRDGDDDLAYRRE